MMDVRDASVLGVVGLLAGAVNGVAGGGTLISFPAMLALGYAPVAANVSSSLAALPGYVGGLVGYRQELRCQMSTAKAMAATSVMGAGVGAGALLVLPSRQFSAAAPILVLIAVAAFALQGSFTKRSATRSGPPHRAWPHSVQFVVSVYGGYFAAGLGVMLLATLRTFHDGTLHELNALKGGLSLLIGGVAAVFFIGFGPVAWGPVAVLSIAGLVGGRAGVGLARHLSPMILQRLIILSGVTLSLALFLK